MVTVLPVLIYPDPILRQRAVDVTVFDVNLEKLVDDMFETMAHYKGIGLAAPQIGVLDRLFILGFEGQEVVFVNPKIVKSDGLTTNEEGCLSLPNVLLNVDRSETITVEATDIKGRPFTLTDSGMIAVIVQHEADHLEGILIIDKGIPSEEEKEI